MGGGMVFSSSVPSALMMMGGSDDTWTCREVRRLVVPSSNRSSYERCGRIRATCALRQSLSSNLALTVWPTVRGGRAFALLS